MTVTVTLEKSEISYGDAMPGYSVSYDEFVGDDDERVLGGALTVSGYKVGDGVGTYTISAGGQSSNNYEITYVVSPSTLTVKAADVSESVSVALDGNLTYNGKEQTQSVKVTVGDTTLVEDEDYTLSGNTGKDAGDGYELTVTFIGNYSGSYSVSWRIAKASVSISWTGDTFTYDGTSKVPGYTASGLVETDGVSISVAITGENVTDGAAINVGSYTATATLPDEAAGNYTISNATHDFTITAAAVSESDVTAPTANNLTYTGEAQALVTAGKTSAGTIVYSLTENGEYSESIPTGTAAGKYTVWYKVVGDGNHNDTEPKSIEVTIAKAALTITVNNAEITYGDAAPEYSVKYSGFVGDEDESVLSGTLEYKCSYKVGDGVGTYTISASGLTSDNYAITYVSGTLTVKASDVNEDNLPVRLDIALEAGTHTYNGEAHKPGVTVKDNGTVLTEGEDYTVEYSNNVNAGTAKVTITFLDGANYSGSYTIEFTINQKELTADMFTVTGEYIYNGNAQSVIYAAYDADGNLTSNDYTVSGQTSGTNAGDYTLTITGQNNYTGTVYVDWSIAAAKVADDIGNVNDGYDVNVTLEYRTTVYDGTEKEPGVTVVVNGITLVEGTDYRVSYIKNINVGTAIVTIRFMGNYSGAIYKSFTITPKALTEDMFTVTGEYIYNGDAHEATYTFSDAEGNLTSSDFTVSYENNIAAGTATIIFTATEDGNYSGEVSLTFEIGKAQPVIPEIPDDWEGEIDEGDKIGTIDPPDGWEWSDPEEVPEADEDGKANVDVTIEVDDDNYDWSNVPGYNPGDGTYTTEVEVTVNPVLGTPDIDAPTAEDGHTYGVTLEDIALIAGANNVGVADGAEWEWVDGSIVPTVTNNGYEARIAIDYDGYDWSGYESSIVEIDGVYYYVVTVDVTIAKAQPEIPEIPDDWEGEIDEGDKIGTIDPPDGWEWSDPEEVPEADEDGKANVDVTIEVDDDNYDWSDVPGYNPGDGTYTTEVEVTVNPDEGDITGGVGSDEGSDDESGTDTATGSGEGDKIIDLLWLIILLIILIIIEIIILLLIIRARKRLEDDDSNPDGEKPDKAAAGAPIALLAVKYIPWQIAAIVVLSVIFVALLVLDIISYSSYRRAKAAADDKLMEQAETSEQSTEQVTPSTGVESVDYGTSPVTEQTQEEIFPDSDADTMTDDSGESAE